MALPKVFATTIQETQEWLHMLTEAAGADNEQEAYAILRAVLHQLRDRLTVDEAVGLGAQLPMLVRGFYYEGWQPAKTPQKIRHAEDFVHAVRERLTGHDAVAVDRAIRAVFALLNSSISQGEIDDVIGMLPADLKAFWPDAAQAHAAAAQGR